MLVVIGGSAARCLALPCLLPPPLLPRDPALLPWAGVMWYLPVVASTDQVLTKAKIITSSMDRQYLDVTYIFKWITPSALADGQIFLQLSLCFAALAGGEEEALMSVVFWCCSVVGEFVILVTLQRLLLLFAEGRRALQGRAAVKHPLSMYFYIYIYV